ncbi:hypothetical protein LC20_06365 [Yersinia hibernica]|uniref:Uncharacterized protein n=1 Tax=Yersinia enterocolitica LC20 TaxID=1443113 RepID=A0A7U5SUE7_YEREN|nr:hypothetical protein LC20_06365 [Yersinia hibernica]OVZ91965.1 hypothetical protein CBW54_04610 [Yersinia kristensenii]
MLLWALNQARQTRPNNILSRHNHIFFFYKIVSLSSKLISTRLFSAAMTPLNLAASAADLTSYLTCSLIYK